MPTRQWVLAALCLAPLVAACDGTSGTTPGPTDPALTSDASTATPDESATTSNSSAMPTPAPVACEVGREATALEASLLVEPGPYSGASFDPEAAADAVIALAPQSPEEWAVAIRTQVQGDLAEPVCETMRYSAEIGDAGAGPTEGPPPEDVVGNNHFSIVLDASGSMAADAGGETRMAAAKNAIESFVGSVPATSTVTVRVYGHEGDNTDAGKAESCASTEVIYDGVADVAAVGESFSDVEPTGWTPLASAIDASQDDIPSDSTDAIVYVVTDGLETCGGDPVQAAQDVAASGIEPVINVIGFQVGDADQEALRAIADAGGGEYTRADSAEALEDFWAEENSRMLSAWREWRDTELARIREESRSNSADTYDLREAVQDVNAEDRDNARAVVEVLDEQGAVGPSLRNQILPLISDREREIRVYVNEQWSENSAEASRVRQEYVTDVTEQGNSRWTEYYAKQFDQR